MRVLRCLRRSSRVNKGCDYNTTQCDDVPPARDNSYIAVKEKEITNLMRDAEFPIDKLNNRVRDLSSRTPYYCPSELKRFKHEIILQIHKEFDDSGHYLFTSSWSHNLRGK